MIILVLIVVLALYGVMTFNRLVRARNIVKEAWSGMDVQLKRRHDLIPNIVEVVKGYASHEKITLEEVVQSRTKSQAMVSGAPNIAERAQIEGAISMQIGRLMAVAEAYPDLKANTNFQSLQHSLTEVEEQIQYARRYYNGAVRDYNTLVQTVPSNFIASFGGFLPSDFFELSDQSERSAPQVSFADRSPQS